MADQSGASNDSDKNVMSKIAGNASDNLNIINRNIFLTIKNNSQRNTVTVKS